MVISAEEITTMICRITACAGLPATPYNLDCDLYLVAYVECILEDLQHRRLNGLAHRGPAAAQNRT